MSNTVKLRPVNRGEVMLLIADSAKERVNRNGVKEGLYMMMFAKGYICNWPIRPFRVF